MVVRVVVLSKLNSPFWGWVIMTCSTFQLIERRISSVLLGPVAQKLSLP